MTGMSAKQCIRLGMILLIFAMPRHVQGSEGKLRIVIPVDEWFTTRGTNIPGTGREAQAVIPWGAQDAWENDFPTESSEIDLQFEMFDSAATPAVAVQNIVNWSLQGRNLAVGYVLSEVAVYSAQAATTYGVAQVASAASSASLSNDDLFPYFSRIAPTSSDYAGTVLGIVADMIAKQGDGWRKVAILTTSDQFGLSTALAIIEKAKDIPEIDVVTWQTFLPGATDVSVEVREIASSDARVIVTFASSGYRFVLEQAESRGILDDYHVYMGGPSVSGPATFRFANGSLDLVTAERLRGHLGISIQLNTKGDRYDRFIDSWTSADPADSPFWGPGTVPSVFLELSYDLGVLVVHAVVQAKNQGLLTHERQPTAEEWTRIVRGITFEGASGPIHLDSNGDRPTPMAITNWRRESLAWKQIGVGSRDEGVEFFPDKEIIWADNTTNYPDLERAPGYYYWSCDASKQKFDETGHSVKLQTPDSGGFDDIDSHYICDSFIDCPNMSDESGDCGYNYTVLFIVFGVITGLLIVFSCCMIPFVMVFGFVLPRRRVRASSPTFLIIIILSCLLGYISEFSWYGRPHPVACGFRPWLLGLAVVSMVSALSAKTWRLWRIFKVSFKKERISDLQLMVLYLIMVAPAVLILVIWTIVSTPSAEVKELYDNHKHYVCTTGGFTGEPGGVIFFFILVGYEGLVLLIAAFLCIVTRNVPSFFNESKLIAISIYNLGFLAAVVIPVIMVLQQINPFASWVIRAVAVLYAFTATLLLQFAPKLFGVFILDRGGDAALPKLGKTTTKSSSSSDCSQPSSG